MNDFEKFYNKALRFLAYRPRSEKEVRDHLMRKSSILRHSGEEDRCNGRDSGHQAELGHGQNDDRESIIEKVIAKLKEQKFLNDEDFAKWWIEQRTRVRPKGISLIKLELKQKGINQDIIESVIFNFQFSIFNEKEKAKKLIEKRIDKWKSLPKQEIYQKLGAYLARRGFDWETIKQSIDYVQSHHERS